MGHNDMTGKCRRCEKLKPKPKTLTEARQLSVTWRPSILYNALNPTGEMCGECVFNELKIKAQFRAK